MGEQRDASARTPKRAVGIRAVLAAAARSGRRYWWRILPVSLVVSLITAVLEIAAEEYVDRTSLSLSALADISASGVSLLGAVFLSGFVCKLVGGTDEGNERTTIRSVLSSLPWARLVGTDVLVALVVIVLLLVLVIPGLVAVNLLALAGPLIEIEHRRVLSSLRRSARLVRRHFWTVALLVTLPVALASEIDTAAPEPRTWPGLGANLAIRGLAEAVAEAVIALILVKLCYRLIELDREVAAAERESNSALESD